MGFAQEAVDILLENVPQHLREEWVAELLRHLVREQRIRINKRAIVSREPIEEWGAELLRQLVIWKRI